MAKARISLRLDRSGIGQIMKSDELLGACVQAGNEVNSRAGGGYSVEPEPSQRSTRVSANVADLRDRAMGREAYLGALAQAVASMEEPWRKK